MEIDPGDLLLFARIVECGSFSLAAERVQLPKSTVSRRITLLEGKLGERLLQRTTRKLVLTEFGASLLEHARKVADETEAAGALAQHRQAAPSGLLRCRCRPISPTWRWAMLAAFMHRYPAISLELDLSPRRVDLVAEGFDLAIRMGNLPDDATLAARRITFSSLALYASPKYTSLRGLPEHPDDLFKHDLLSLPPRLNGLMRWICCAARRRGSANCRCACWPIRRNCWCAWRRPASASARRPRRSRGRMCRRGSWCGCCPSGLPAVTGWAVFPGGG
jgi:DNA-binding transcriptional LysR family regulator